MRDLDETDMEILRLLAENARRPYSEIAEAVGLSGPAVSDRVERLEAAGVINGFTVDVDQSQLRAGVPVFVRATVPPGTVADCKAALVDADAVEHVFVTADGDCWFYARAQLQRVHEWLEGLFPVDGVDYDVTLIDDAEWTPSLDGTAFALTCAECGNTVDSEGESTRIDGEVYHFCCQSCRGRFEERYDRLEEAA
ncbi:AsnC family transcriptional regulator [Haloterrigena sp. H1]|uniref:AsnC family transcriptional regulator n=1 Tax=Haloterrigena sp. H1 TaxID=2552943 RepID=UPI00110E7F8C|nr:AsnC family transcriptional regulator [Haloterrigena sp. H1]TMT77914.1 AsnC family transcriptional regulator [Haloterrigena sp. H1]TMT78487.1 AsnC family transcriptional regulator [Haloterrigena sp. H1]TMT80410.1 AsnC family transcriptional regulator [Haloterrigena sp. H1]